MPYLFTFREILNLAKEFGRSLPGKHLIPRYFNIDRYARQKYGLISMCILSFDTNTTVVCAHLYRICILCNSPILRGVVPRLCCLASEVRHPSEVGNLRFMTILKSFYCPVTAYMYTLPLKEAIPYI